MKNTTTIVATLAFALLRTSVQAGGLDRTGQSLDALFSKGDVLTVDIAHVKPHIQGSDVLGKTTGKVAETYSQWSFSYKKNLNSQTSLLVMLSQPFGLDIRYDPQQSPLLGGTKSWLQTHELMGVLRYRQDEHWSLHGGLRLQRSEGQIGFGGLAFGPASGYQVNFFPSTAPGYLLGLSYERPDTALRITGTYYSSVHHRIRTHENFFPLTTTTASTSPQSFNLDIQTALTPRTLFFGQIRRTQWSQFRLSPQFFSAATNGASLADIEDSTTYMIGLGHKLSSKWSGIVSVSYDRKSETDPLSALRPSNGRTGYTLAVNYEAEHFQITPWVSYQRLGKADAFLASYPIAHFDQGSAIALGVRLSYMF